MVNARELVLSSSFTPHSSSVKYGMRHLRTLLQTTDIIIAHICLYCLQGNACLRVIIIQSKRGSFVQVVSQIFKLNVPGLLTPTCLVLQKDVQFHSQYMSMICRLIKRFSH